MKDTSIYQAMKNYRAAYQITRSLREKHQSTVNLMGELACDISKAEAHENQMREAMLLAIQKGGENAGS